MHKILTLTKVLIKNNSFFNFSKNEKINKWLSLFFLILLLPISLSIVFMVSNLYSALVRIDQEGIILAYGIALLMIVTFFFGSIQAVSVLYFSKDAETLLHMPFKPSEIISSKMLVILLLEYLIYIMIYVPMIITFGVKAGFDFIFYLYAFLILIILPIVPLAIGTILVMIIMRFSNIGKNKERVTMLSGVVILLVVLGFNLSLQKLMMAGQTESELVALVMKGQNSFVNVIGRLFPGTSNATNALIQSNDLNGLLQLGIFFVIAFLSVFVFFFLANKIYFKGLLGISEVSNAEEAIATKEWSSITRRKNQMICMMEKEIKILLRTPIYMLNNVLVSVLLPIIFVIIFIVSPKSDPDIEALMNLLTNSTKLTNIIPIFFGAGVFLGGINGVSTTAISREGSSAYVMKYLPFHLEKQILSKVLVGVVLGIISLIFLSIGMIMLKVSVLNVFIGLIFGIIGILLINFIGITIDLIKPKLIWDSETQAVKQNMNLVVLILVAALLGFGPGYLTIKMNLNLLFVVGIYGVLMSVLSFVIYTSIFKWALKKFSEMDL